METRGRQHPAVGEFRKVACFAEEAFEGFGIADVMVGATGEADVLVPAEEVAAGGYDGNFRAFAVHFTKKQFSGMSRRMVARRTEWRVSQLPTDLRTMWVLFG